MARSAVSPIAYRQGEGETFWSFGALATVKASGETTGGRVGVIELLAPKGAGSPMHVHHREDEWFYVTEGELAFWVGGRVIPAAAGAFVFGPRDIPHTFMVRSALARFLLVADQQASRSSCANSPSLRSPEHHLPRPASRRTCSVSETRRPDMASRSSVLPGFPSRPR